MEHEVDSFSVLNISAIDTKSLCKLLLPGFFTDDQFIQVDTGQIGNTSNQGLVIWNKWCQLVYAVGRGIPGAWTIF